MHGSPRSCFGYDQGYSCSLIDDSLKAQGNLSECVRSTYCSLSGKTNDYDIWLAVQEQLDQLEASVIFVPDRHALLEIVLFQQEQPWYQHHVFAGHMTDHIPYIPQNLQLLVSRLR